MITENLDVFLGELGVACSCGVYAFTGLLDAPDQTLSQGGLNVLSTMYALQVKTSDVVAGSIATGSALVVNGQAYVVRDVLSHEDGAFSVLTLSR